MSCPRGCAADPGGDGAPKGLVQRPFEKGHPGTKIRPAGCRPGTRLCFGVIQNRMLLDHYLQQYSAMKLSKMESKVRNNLRVGAVPDAFYDQDSRQRGGKRRGKADQEALQKSRAGGMVNGILRNLARHLDELPTLDRGNPVAYLSLLYSHPHVVGGGMEPAVGSGGGWKNCSAGTTVNPL